MKMSGMLGDVFSLFLGVRAEPVLETLVRSSSHEGNELLVLLE